MLNKHLFYKAWGRLLLAYLISFALSFGTGSLCIALLGVQAETLFEMSTKRLSFAVPIMQSAATLGLDEGLVLFAWNSLGALITISFLYTAALFNPGNIKRFPQTIRKIFCGRKRMKLLCFLPGCRGFEEESLRRLYVWLMIPWLGMILLGVESGLVVSTSAALLGSFAIGVSSLALHGIIEIPAFAYAGAVVFCAHLLLKEEGREEKIDEIFQHLESYKMGVPLLRIILLVTGALFIAGLVEAHVTSQLVEFLQAP